MDLSDTQRLRTIKLPEVNEATSNADMATGLDAFAHKFKQLAQELREGKVFTCPACGSAAFAGTDEDGDVHIDMQLHFKLTIPAKNAGPN